MKRFVPIWLAIVLGSLLTAPCSKAQFPAAPGTGPGLPETIEAIDSARVTTRILYITAHPDDESAAVLTYLARGLHADVALLSLTRGEGGQNALGPEQAPQLGLIRTQELLAATRGYGVKLYFTRAKDFGYSKTPAETQKIWGDAVLEDMVRIIREFRPNIVINHWGGVHSGHGHHQASGILTPKAVALASDSSYKLDTLSDGEPGDSPKYSWAPSDGITILRLDRSDAPKGFILPLDEISSLYGKSWREIGLDAFVNHHTQGIAGFLNSPFLRRPIALVREDGEALDPQILAQPFLKIQDWEGCKKSPNSCAGLKVADEKILEAKKAALQFDWATATNNLNTARLQVDWLIPHRDFIDGLPWSETAITAEHVKQRIIDAMLLTAGFTMTAEADRTYAVADETAKVMVRYSCRDGVECPVKTSYEENNLKSVVSGPIIVIASAMQSPVANADFKKGVEFSVKLPTPYVEQSILDSLKPDKEFAKFACVKVSADDHGTYYSTRCVPIVHTEATTTSAVRVPVRVVPAYTLSVDPSQTVELLSKPKEPFDVFLRVHSYSTKPARISVGLDVPDGLKSSAPVELSFDGVGDQYARLTVTPPANFPSGNYTITAYAKRGDERFSTSLEPLPSMPTILWSEPAQTVVHAFDINVPANLRVGYISAESEPIPDALKRLGINVEMLDANALNFGDLSKYNAIVVGVRAYELRPELTSANKRLLDYVSNGGTLVVQYNRDYIWDKLQPAPYPAKIGSPTPRITDEHAAVTLLYPDDPLLNQPNKITQSDFDNWIQERGLYFWSDFDSKYTPLLSMHDPNESALNGALVYTRYGKGMYIYTGLAFFRQLPEGVPGAYRLFVNLLSANHAN